MARVAVALMLLAWLGLGQWRMGAQQEAKRVEKTWTQSLQVPNKSDKERLQARLTAAGCQLWREAGKTRIEFEGNQEKYITLVNELLQENYPWESWKVKKTSTGQVEATMVVGAL